MNKNEIVNEKKEKKYHHGNLRQALIEAGIEMMNEVGEEGLSLRKIAAKCGVSNAAPYAHFTGKEELIQGMQEYVQQSFVEKLKTEAEKYSDTELAILAIGKAYVMFFIEHPQYFKFLYFRENISVDLNMRSTGNCPAFELLRVYIQRFNQEKGIVKSVYEQELEIIKLWSDVQGLSSIASMKHVHWNHPWEETIERMLGLHDRQR